MFFTGIPYERALHSLHGVLCARSRPTAQLSSAQCTQLQINSAVGFSPSAQMQQTASIPTAHHSPFGLCLLLVLLLLAVATYSDYFTLTSVHVCLSCSSGVLYRFSNADYAGESSPQAQCHYKAAVITNLISQYICTNKGGGVYLPW